jgi:hypothetical protein
MKIYRCKKRFLCGPLERYIPVGAHVARYDNIVKIALLDAPDSENLFSILVNGVEYATPDKVTWISVLVPPTNLDYFDFVSSIEEDAYGNVSTDTGSVDYVVPVWNITSGAVQSDLFTDGISGKITLDPSSTVQFRLQLAGYTSSDNKGVAYEVRGCIRRDNMNNTVMVGTLTKEVWEDGGLEGADVTVTADDVNEAMKITVTGVAAKNFSWRGLVFLSRVVLV